MPVLPFIDPAAQLPGDGAALLSAKEDKASKGVANGYAPLDATARVPGANLPANLVTTTGTQTLTNKTITSPAGLVKGDVGLGNVDNTSDANKPVSTAGQTALNLKADQTAVNLKAPLASPTFTGTVTVPAPVNATDAVTKTYADTTIGLVQSLLVSFDLSQSNVDLGRTAAWFQKIMPPANIAALTGGFPCRLTEISCVITSTNLNESVLGASSAGAIFAIPPSFSLASASSGGNLYSSELSIGKRPIIGNYTQTRGRDFRTGAAATVQGMSPFTSASGLFIVSGQLPTYLSSTLSSAITTTAQTTMTLAVSATQPNALTFVKINNEVVFITGVSGQTYTIVRGQFETRKETHPVSSVVSANIARILIQDTFAGRGGGDLTTGGRQTPTFSSLQTTAIWRRINISGDTIFTTNSFGDPAASAWGASQSSAGILLLPGFVGSVPPLLEIKASIGMSQLGSGTIGSAQNGRGLGLGFFSGAGGGGFSQARFTGLVLDSAGRLNFAHDPNAGGFFGAGSILGTAVAYGGTFVAANYHDLSYQINTATGAISNISLEGSSADYSSLAAGVNKFTAANVLYAGVYTSSENTPAMTGFTSFDNFTVTATPVVAAKIYATFRRII